jgi:tRNA (mo5U34)-methyltransferase
VARKLWYHTIELAPGLITPGFFDHRPIVHKVLPPALNGRRCLDVATFDGFWAVEMAFRDAAEVVAMDCLDIRRWDWPPGSSDETVKGMSDRLSDGQGFTLVTETLNYEIPRIDCSVYELDPEDFGTFDFVFVGSLMLHVRDPVNALMKIRRMISSGGELCLMDNVDPITSLTHPWRPVATLDGLGRPWWWRFNLAGLTRLITSAGFDLIASPERLRLARGKGRPLPSLSLRTLRDAALRTELHEGILGDAHAVIRAQPRRDL